MTDKIDDGGPAFPGKYVSMIINGEAKQFGFVKGMSLRDWFAGQALHFCLREFGGNSDDMKQYAEAAYQIADAMLAERRKGKL